MVKRKDFRPNNSSYSISDKDRETIRKYNAKHRNKSFETEREKESILKRHLPNKNTKIEMGDYKTNPNGYVSDIYGKKKVYVNHIQYNKTDKGYINSNGEALHYTDLNTNVTENELSKGTSQEAKEHPSLSKKQSEQVAKDHLKENPEYYNAEYENMTTREKLEEDKKHSLKIVENKNSQYSPFEKDMLSEQEVNLMMRRINAKKIEPSKIRNIENGQGYELTEEQNRKGFAWLNDKYKSPSGKERKNSPYGYREQAILEKPDRITLIDVYSERGNWYQPVYRVYGDDGNSFDYYVRDGQPYIIG